MFKLKFFLLICLMLFNGFLHATDKDDLEKVKLPKFDVLKGMQVAWAAEKMRYNGLPASIQNFSSKDSVEDLFQRYESKWKVKGFNAVARSKIMEMDVLGIKQPDGAYFTIQAKNTANGGSAGHLIVSLSPLDAKSDLKTDFPLYPQTKVINIIESYDGGITAETIIATNTRSVNANVNWLKSRLSFKGWVEQSFQDNPMLNPDMSQLSFQRQSQLCQITISKENAYGRNKTMILINWIK